jgi:mannose-6-phosphate isomerase-like protein (cupin superfamily)
MADVQTRTRVVHLPDRIAEGGFHPLTGPGAGRLGGYTIIDLAPDRERTKHLVEIVNIEPGSSKFNHYHDGAETITIILEGEGEYVLDEDVTVPVKPGDICMSLPGQIHGSRNTGNTPLRYFVVEGPLPLQMQEGARPKPGNTPNRKLTLKEVINTWNFVEIKPENMPAQMRSPQGESRGQRPELSGYTVVFLVDHPESLHQVEIVNIEPGHGKFAHYHDNAETFQYFVEGEGEFILGDGQTMPVKPGTMTHSYPGEVHGTINKGNTPLRYVVIEGPLPLGGTSAVEVH